MEGVPKTPLPPGFCGVLLSPESEKKLLDTSFSEIRLQLVTIAKLKMNVMKNKDLCITYFS